MSEITAMAERPACDEVINLNLKQVSDLEFDGIDMGDYPDFCDAFLSDGNYIEDDGTVRILTEEELEYLRDECPEWFYEKLWEYLY